MSVIIFAAKAFKRLFKSKLTWFLIILWTFFVALFLFFDFPEHELFNHWVAEVSLLLFTLFAGYAGILFFRYNSYMYIIQIDNQNHLLRQREKMLVKTNERLTRQTDFLNLVTNSFSHPFFVIDANTYEILMANKAFYEHHELPNNFELRKSKCFVLSHHFNSPCNTTDHPCPLKEVKETRKPVITEHIHKTPNGEERIMEITAFPVFDEKTGKVKQILEYNIDITERTKEQLALAEKEQRLRKIITTSPDGIAVTDLNGSIKFASEKSAALLRYDHPDQLIGKNVFDFLHPDDLEKAHRAAKYLIENKLSYDTREFKTLRPDGTVFYQETNASLLYDNKNRPHRLVLISRDITDRKITEQRLVNLNKQLSEKSIALEDLNRSLEERIQKALQESREKDRILTLQSRQAAMGELIGNIAHQWRQPLNAINLIIFDLLEAYKYKELDENYLNNSYNEINRVVQNMSQTIDDFRNFFKPVKEKKLFDINTIIEQSLHFSSAGLAANNIHLTFKKNGSIMVMGYPNELIQTLINIIQNAKDALLESHNTNKNIWINSHVENDYALISINNNGGIIPPDHLEKVFDPYYSTKPEGHGTGMGLFISKTIIEKNMKGNLNVKNIENGVCFEIKMKVSAQT